MAAEYPAATWVAIPGFGFPTGAHGGNTPRFVILHGTASGDGTVQQQVSFFQGTNQHGVHFVIGKDGQVVQMVALADSAYGNCCIDVALHDAFWDTVLQSFNNLNNCTISIEHCKIASDNSDLLTPAQQDASFRLVAWLCDTLNIPARWADASGGITGHYSINGINRANCPGPYPWNELWAFLREQHMDPQYQPVAGKPGFWSANGHEFGGWIAENVLASVNADKLSTFIGLPQEDAHLDADGRWRQRLTYAIASQHVSNQPDFTFEPLPLPPPPPGSGSSSPADEWFAATLKLFPHLA